MFKKVLLISFLFSSCNESLPKDSTCDQAIKYISKCVLNTDQFIIYLSNKEQFCLRKDLDLFFTMSCEEIKREYF